MGTSFLGWDAHILANDLVRIVIVPALGGRVMAFDLDEYAALWVNPALVGQVAVPDPRREWPNVGGYKTWPAPQDQWGWNWPPPPILDHGSYTTILNRHGGSPPHEAAPLSARTVGPVEQWSTPGLRFERTFTLQPGSARVRVEQTLTNVSSQPQQWSVWDITQHPVESAPGAADFDHFVVYFPLNPRSIYGLRGVRVSAESGAWLGKVAPGVFGATFRPENKKVFADPALGWIAYTDQTPRAGASGLAYVKLFGIDPAAAYPDEGARVEVWINQAPVYLEVEILGPLVEIAPEGGSSTLTETWGACVYGGGVIVRASQAGVVAERLAWDSAAGRLSGRGGVFDVGRAQIGWLDRDGEVLAIGPAQPVTPREPLVLDLSAAPPPGAAAVEVYIVDQTGEIVGVWDGCVL